MLREFYQGCICPSGTGQPAGDPNFANVVTLLHLDGTDGQQVFTDSSNANNTWTARAAGDQLDDAQARFGATSLVVQSGIAVGNVADFDFGTGDFTFECWFRPTAINDFQYMFSNSDGTGVVGINLLIDLVYAVVDPRVRYD